MNEKFNENLDKINKLEVELDEITTIINAATIDFDLKKEEYCYVYDIVDKLRFNIKKAKIEKDDEIDKINSLKKINFFILVIFSIFAVVGLISFTFSFAFIESLLFGGLLSGILIYRNILNIKKINKNIFSLELIIKENMDKKNIEAYKLQIINRKLIESFENLNKKKEIMIKKKFELSEIRNAHKEYTYKNNNDCLYSQSIIKKDNSEDFKSKTLIKKKIDR